MEVLIIFISALIVSASQAYIKRTYGKYSKIKNTKGLTGAEVARKILKKHGLGKIYIVETQGSLTDHYDPSRKVVRLSTSNYNDSSIAAVSVAAHECGHALQDKDGYTFMRIRAFLVPFVNFSSRVGYVVITISILASMVGIFLRDFLFLGILLEIVVLLFQIVTLPVEINASKRALAIIKEEGYLDSYEYKEGRSMLIAAALTYVASVATNLLEILRLVIIYTRRD